MDRSRLAKRLLIAVIAALAAGAVSMLAPFRTGVDGIAYDLTLAARAAIFGGDSYADSPIIVIAVDQRTLDAPEAQAPRALFSPLWAEVGEKAFNAGAVVVAFDFVLEFDAARMRLGDEALTQAFRRYDTPFLKLLRREGRAGRLLLGRTADSTPARRFAAMAGRTATAFVEVTLDRDGVVRRSAASAPLANGGSAATLSGKLRAALGDTNPAPFLLAPPARLSAMPAISMIDVLACDDPTALEAALKGRAVVIGSVLPDEDRLIAPDRFMPSVAPTALLGPCGFSGVDATGANLRTTPGVFVHAAAVDAAIRGWGISLPSLLTLGFTVAIAAFVAALLGVLLSPIAAGLAVLALGGGIAAASVGALEFGAVLPAGRMMLATAAAFAMGWGARVLLLEGRSRRLQRSFGAYLAPALVERLADAEIQPTLGGETRSVTIMFADLSGFTALSEIVDSATLTRLVNRYLALIAEEVDKSGGYIDKFIGDAAMAIWNAPAALDNHGQVAARAAWAIDRAVAAAEAEDRAAGGTGFSIKIGVNTGQATVGNVGAPKRLNYTAVGEAVNLAARFESLPPDFGLRIVLGPETAEGARHDFVVMALADIVVKGKTQPVTVSTILAEISNADEGLIQLKDSYEATLGVFRDGDFDRAEEGWQQLSKMDWPGAGPATAMLGHLNNARAERAAGHWTGALRKTDK